MTVKRAGDILVSLDDYPLVNSSATIFEAVVRLAESRKEMDAVKQPYQAVLVVDDNRKIVGKIGQFSILKSLEPQMRLSDDDSLVKAGVSSDLIKTAFDHYRSMQLDISDLCLGISNLSVSQVMTPFDEHLDINTPISEVVHKILEWRTLSIIITENNHPVGLVRLSDICDEIIKQVQQQADSLKNED